MPEAKAACDRALGTIESDARAQGRKTARGDGDPVVFHRGPSTGNQLQLAAGRVFPRSERDPDGDGGRAGAPVWTGVLLDRNGTKTVVPVTAGERTDAATGQRWLTADITLAPLGPGDYVVELTTVKDAADDDARRHPRDAIVGFYFYPRGFAPRTPPQLSRSPLRRLAPIALARSRCSLASHTATPGFMRNVPPRSRNQRR